MSATDGDDDAGVLEDPRMPPRWYFAGIGAAAALMTLATRLHLAIFVPAVVLMAVVLVVGHRRYRVGDPHRNIAPNALRGPLHGPLPGVGFLVAAVMVMNTSFVAFATLVPRDALPIWAGTAIAMTVGITVAVLLYQAVRRQLAGVRRLERGLRPDERSEQGGSA